MAKKTCQECGGSGEIEVDGELIVCENCDGEGYLED
jgi:DnaJ-class molecular chaperone